MKEKEKKGEELELPVNDQSTSFFSSHPRIRTHKFRWEISGFFSPCLQLSSLIINILVSLLIVISCHFTDTFDLLTRYMFNFIKTSFYILFVRVLSSIHTNLSFSLFLFSPSPLSTIRIYVQRSFAFVLFINYVSLLSSNETYVGRSYFWKMIGGDTNKIITYMDVERDVVARKTGRDIANAETIIQVSCFYLFFLMYNVYNIIYIYTHAYI